MIESASEGPGSPEGGIETESAGDDGVDETDICSSSGTEMDGDNDNNNNDNDTPEETPSPYCAHTRRATVPVSEHRVKPARLDPELVQKSPKLPASNSHRNVGFVPVSYTTPPPLPAPPRPKERRASEAGDATSEEKSASPSQTAETASVLSEAQATVRTQQVFPFFSRLTYSLVQPVMCQRCAVTRGLCKPTSFLLHVSRGVLCLAAMQFTTIVSKVTT